MAKKHTVTHTSELALEPQIREFAGARYLGAVLGVAILVVLALVAVRELSSIEQLLAAEGTSSARAVVYELPAGTELHVPIEPRTDVLRFMVHAYRRGSDLPLTPRSARVTIEARGDRATHTESLDASLPGLRTRITAQEPGLAVGDPTAFDVDVHDVGVGEVIVKLTGIDDADGVLVRAYRREQLSPSEALVRATALDRHKKDRLAQWTWEIGWDELTEAERSAVLATRWHRVGALRGSGQELKSIAVALSPAGESVHATHGDPLLGRVALRGDERISLLLRAGATVSAVADASVTIRATMRLSTGDILVRDGFGKLTVTATDADLTGVEFTSDRDVIVEVRAPDPEKVEWLGLAPAWRTTAARPIVIESPETRRVLRVSIRRSMDRRDASVTTLAARIDITAPSLPRPFSQTFRVERPRSRVDRYEAFDPLDAPSERATFYVVVPEAGTARITPAAGGSLDVTLAELDESAPPAPLATRPIGAPISHVRIEGDTPDTTFIARRPSNLGDFDAEARPVLRLARRYAPVDPDGALSLAHVKHTNSARVERGGRPFEAVSKPFDMDPSAKRPLVVPLVAFASKPTTLTIELLRDGPQPRAGVFTHWTLPRSIEVGTDEVRAAFVIGDDVGGARAKLRVTESAPAEARVHFPWAAAHTPGPRWIAGQFED